MWVESRRVELSRVDRLRVLFFPSADVRMRGRLRAQTWRGRSVCSCVRAEQGRADAGVRATLRARADGGSVQFFRINYLSGL